MSLYQNKYRIESTRLKNWDYSANGYYFITICTDNMQKIFGKVIDGKMVLSDVGKIAESELLKSFEIRAELFCEIYCVMPNHIHVLVQIENVNEEMHGSVSEQHGSASVTINNNIFSADGFNKNISAKADKKYGVAYRVPKSISSFVAGFKSSATKKINEFRNTPKLPVWQERFHDHIVRNEEEFNRIRMYIKNNPLKWEKDKCK